MKPGIQVEICPTSDELADRAARRILAELRQAVAWRGRFSLALAGGSTPEKTYVRLAELSADPAQGGEAIDWSAALVLMSDERFVPPDDPRSNYGMARRTLLGRPPASLSQIYPVPTERPTPAEAATAYQRTIAEVLGSPLPGPPPRLDLILLGLGDDGHTASLFPHAAALGEDRAWVTSSPPGTLPPPVDRVTFTYPLLRAARAVLMLVAGRQKAEAVRDVLSGHFLPIDRPAAGVRPTDGTMTWMLDAAAASLL